jgi:hypothetical protein
MVLRLLEYFARRRPGGSGVWTGVALAAFLLRRHHRHEAQRRIVLREELGPGESLLIRHTTQPRG